MATPNPAQADALVAHAKSYAGFAEAPHAGDVVLCRFPYVVSGKLDSKPGPNVHPGVVLQVLEPSAEQPGVPRITVCYGVTSPKRVFPWDLVIEPRDHPDEAAAAGLIHPTKFDLSQRATVPFHREWFLVPAQLKERNTPKIGELLPASVDRLMDAWRQIEQRGKRVLKMG